MAFRTKKISQMDPKGSNLASTDLLEISELVSGSYVTKSITGAEIIASVPPTTVEWGDIGGTLSAQTDLNTALSGKQDDITLTTTGTSGASTFVANTLNVPAYSLSGLGGVPTSRTLTINGTTQDLSADRTFTISTGITIGSTAITSGAVGRVLFEGTGNVVQESANLFWDNTNVRLGVGTATPTNTLNIYTSVANYGLRLQSNSTGANLIGTEYLWDATQLGTFSVNGSSGEFKWFMKSGGFFPTIYSNGVERLRIATTGNVLINTTTDAGFKLDVNGTARVSGVTLIGSSLISASAYPLQVVGGAGGSALFSNTTRTQALNINLTTSGETRIYVDYFLTGTDQKLILGSYANRANQLVLNTTGNVSIGTTTEITSAILQADSTTRGFLPPRLTTTQKNAITSPATGLMVYDTTLNLISVYNGTTWITL